jgi:hypothetical protein
LPSVGGFTILLAGVLLGAVRRLLRRRAIDGLNGLRERGTVIRNEATLVSFDDRQLVREARIHPLG